jgi:hypothetical protein
VKKFEKIMRSINRTICPFGIGFAAYDLFTKDYKSAAWVLFVVAILLMVEHMARLCSD